MQTDFSQIDTSVIDRMALFIGILAVGGMLKLIKMPFFIMRIGVGFTGLGWIYYWATEILSKF